METLEPGRNEPGLAQALVSYRSALGRTYDSMNVIALGIHGMRMASHAARADDRLLEDAAAELAGMAAAHELFIRQFPDWLDYVNDRMPEPTDEAVDTAAQVARAALDEPELISDDVTEPLIDLAEASLPSLAADPAVRPPQPVQRELLRSMGNVLSGLLSPFVEYAREAGGKARKASLDGVEEGSKTLSKNLIEKAPRVIAFGSLALILATALPAEFAWLIPVIAFLKLRLK